VVTAEEMGRLDRLAESQFGIPSIVLMENAGLRVFESIKRYFHNFLAGRRVAVFCGKGNNGGDGIVVARHLLNQGSEVKVFLLGSPQDLKGDPQINLKIYQKMGGRLYPLTEENHLQRVDISLLYADLVVDAIFGTGFKGAALGLAAEVIQRINGSGKPVVAVDLPSGLEADTGKVWGPCVRARWTVTFALPKLGLVVEPGASYAGALEIADIGIPYKLVEEQGLTLSLLTPVFCRQHLPPRDPSSHKGTYGHVLALGGSPGFTGAITLTARAALRAGAGLVTAAVPRGCQPVVAAGAPEIMTWGLPETAGGSLGRSALDPLLERLENFSVLAIGPGLGRDPETVELVKSLLPRASIPLVVDADALNALATDTGILSQPHGPMVLTPHPGEMGRLIGCPAAKIQEDRLNIARRYAQEWRCVLLLKGARTVVACPDGGAYINPTGNPGMATGGSGDVLTGIIAGLIAQGMSLDKAAAIGAYLHGAAGDLAAEELGQEALIARDILHFLPRAFKSLGGGAVAPTALGRSGS